MNLSKGNIAKKKNSNFNRGSKIDYESRDY